MPKISIIITKSPEAELTAEWAESQLQDIDHEIIIARNWTSGLAAARGTYVCFLERDCVLGKNYFEPLLESFENNPLYRKLAMVAPAVGIESYTNTIFGYIIGSVDIHASFSASSSQPYLVQSAYIPGALIRRSAIPDLLIGEKDLILKSVITCLGLWSNGQRILLNPHSLYISSDARLGIPLGFPRRSEVLGDTREVTALFRREAIG